MAKHAPLSSRRPPLDCEQDISDDYKAAIDTALRWAWAEVCARWPDEVATAREEQITKRIWDALNEHDASGRRLAPGLELFETVERGSKVNSADDGVDRAPDLVMRPPALNVRRRNDWGAFIECKIIGPEGHHSPREYCVNGVARFVQGHYAPRMPSGTMLAYVRDRRTPHASLSPILGEPPYNTRRHDVVTTDTSRSEHYRGSQPAPCVTITLTHLWLDAPSAPARRPRSSTP